MALRLVTRSRQLAVLYSKSLRHLSQGLRQFSTNDDAVGQDENTIIEVRQVWPSPASDLLGEGDRRLTLPGGVGMAEHLLPPTPPAQPRTPTGPRSRSAGPNSLNAFYDDRYMAAMFTYLSPLSDMSSPPEDVATAADGRRTAVLEIQAHDCPQLLKQEFRTLFTERDISAGQLTVLVVSQKTELDMSAWSEEMESERAELATHFLAVGKDIVLRLRRLGLWADLIDPRSGRPHLSAFLPSEGADDRLIETDPRLGQLGFTIEDLGCCKVIQHALWGSHVFVGCMFTDAALDDPRLHDVMSRYSSAEHASSSSGPADTDAANS